MKMHLNLATRNLDASVAFYRILLAAEPAKHYPDYALFVTENPGLELALDADPAITVHEGAHYGVVVEKAEDVEAAIVRFRAAGHAVQNKVWAVDPDGRRWETYFVIADTEERDQHDASETAATTACC